MNKKPSKRELLAQRERERIALEARNTNIMDDLIRGMSKKALAEKYNLSRATIHDIITQARDLWREYRIDDYELQLTIELERINRIEAEAWDAYEKSKKPIVTTTRRTDGQRVIDEETGKEKLNIIYEEVKSQTRHPDPRYLNIIEWCTEQRLKIMGGYAPEKHAATTPDGKNAAPFKQITFIEVVRPVETKTDVIEVQAQALPDGR